MNGTSRLYRSTSERMLGGVAAGLGNYFKIDANIIRLIWLVLALVTGGGFALIYLALWLLLPTATSTATDVNGVIHENLNDMAAQFNNYTGMRAHNGGNGGVTQPNATPVDASAAANGGNMGAQPQLPQVAASTRPRQGNGAIALIVIGVFFLMANTGLFRGIHFGFLWPLMLIGIGAMMISRRS